MGGLRTLGLAFKEEKRPRPLSLLSFIPGLQGRVLLYHMQHHDIRPRTGLKATGTTSQDRSL